MIRFGGLLVCLVACGWAPFVSAAEITGEYIEARTCDVYTGPCFANGEIGLTGREAVMAWKVDEGAWAGQDLSGLCVALVLRASDTLGVGGSFKIDPFPVSSVILVDEKANSAQREALVKFVKENAKQWTENIARVQPAALSLTNDHVGGKGVFTAGKFARIETRKLKGGDCVCTNETVFYPPLNKVDNAHPAYTLDLTYQGEGLNSTWKTMNRRSAFLATFSR